MDKIRILGAIVGYLIYKLFVANLWFPSNGGINWGGVVMAGLFTGFFAMLFGAIFKDSKNNDE